MACWVTCAPLHAIDPDRRLDQLYHTAWTAKDAAPVSVREWAQTPDGFLWFGNRNGLFRFDGARFERYEAVSGAVMPKMAINALTTLADGSLLIAWQAGGLSRLKGGEFKDYPGPGGDPVRADVQEFQKGGDGSLWAARVNGTIFRLDGNGHWSQVGTELPLPQARPNLFYADHQGTLWVGTEKRLFFLRRGETAFREIPGNGQPLLPVRGQRMAQSPDGSLWLASPASIRSIDQNGIGPEIMRAPSGQPFGDYLFVDSEGSIWSGGNGRGILRIPHPRNSSPGKPVRVETFAAQDGLTSDLVTKIFQDREGNMWNATSNGLDSFRQSNVVPVRFPTSRDYVFLDNSGEDVRVIAYFPTSVFTIRDGSMVDARPWPFKTLAVYPGKNGVTWLGTEGHGIAKFVNGQGQPLDSPGLVVIHIAEDEKRRVWALVTGKGMMVLDDGKWKSGREMGVPSQYGRETSFTDSRDRTWFGDRDNQVEVLEHGKFMAFGAKEGVRAGTCREIREADGSIFISGDQAVEMFNGRSFLPIVPEDRVAFKNVWGLIASGRSGLWFGETRGIVHISVEELRKFRNDPRHRVSYELYNIYDGLSSDLQRGIINPASLESPDGRIWFATTAGLVWIDPRQMAHNSIAPGVAVDSLTVEEKEYHFLSPLTLPARTTSLRIAFTAASMTIPERVHFRYMLEGVDKHWQESGTRREASYTNLGPGSYRFRVIACNNDGVWNEAGAVSNFTIAPTFYQTTWFRAFCVLIAGALMVAAYRFRVRQIATAMNARANERLMERSRIARDLHDTLLQSFHGLMLRFHSVSTMLPDGEAKKELEKTLERADLAIAEGRSAVYDLRVSATGTKDFPQALTEVGSELSGDHGAAFNLTVAGRVRDLLPIIRDELYRIAREALINAFKHARANHVELEVSYGPKLFRLRVRDDGAGIPLEIQDQGRKGHFGLAGMRERAKQIGADLTVWSREGAGTEIDLSLASKIAYGISPRGPWFRAFRKSQR